MSDSLTNMCFTANRRTGDPFYLGTAASNHSHKTPPRMKSEPGPPMTLRAAALAGVRFIVWVPGLRPSGRARSRRTWAAVRLFQLADLRDRAICPRGHSTPPLHEAVLRPWSCHCGTEGSNPASSSGESGANLCTAAAPVVGGRAFSVGGFAQAAFEDIPRPLRRKDTPPPRSGQIPFVLSELGDIAPLSAGPSASGQRRTKQEHSRLSMRPTRKGSGRNEIGSLCSGAHVKIGLSRQRPQARWRHPSDARAPQRAADVPFQRKRSDARVIRNATADRPFA